MTIGERIRARRKELRMTQTDLARASIYADRSMLSRIEHDQIDPPLSRVEAIAKALKISPSVICGWE